jgi:hypothetical protein
MESLPAPVQIPSEKQVMNVTVRGY